MLDTIKKEWKLWYPNLKVGGKVLFWGAVVALILLLLQFTNWLSGFFSPDGETLVPTLGDLIGFWALLINTILIGLVVFVVAQFLLLRSMRQEQLEEHRQMITRGRKGGNPLEAMSGVRNRGMRPGRAPQMQQRVAYNVSADKINQQFRPKLLARPTKVVAWKDITEPGVYALVAQPKDKIEIIDATEVTGGFYVGRWYKGRFFRSRQLAMHKKTNTPLQFSSVRSTKKYLRSTIPDDSTESD
ncbi:MAG: hypothetical protein M9941_18315 [Anaerolineae bacterium]|nr:hypothetical protein [Anaerolineae bacterium]MCO5199695.1 hypothetical protein [Anaerolineae bacterium]